jgi:hypothetical protein
VPKCDHPRLKLIQFGEVVVVNHQFPDGWRYGERVVSVNVRFLAKCEDCEMSRFYSKTKLPKWLEKRLPSTFHR